MCDCVDPPGFSCLCLQPQLFRAGNAEERSQLAAVELQVVQALPPSPFYTRSIPTFGSIECGDDVERVACVSCLVGLMTYTAD
jgi:hypothetical protein